MAAIGIAAAVFLTAVAVLSGDWVFVAMAAPLGVPATVFPWVLAVQIDRMPYGIVVTNLFWVRRRVRREDLGVPRVRLTAQGAILHIHAPRAWIPVRRSWPIYVDLMAEIPDQATFRSYFRLPR
jgi:hypothetical protein